MMRAARWLARRNITLETVPLPHPADDEALIAVDWVGLCGSDVEEYVEGPVVITPPITLGHEIVGTVASAAADGSGPSVGTRVVVDVVTGCGHCYWCDRHEEGLCPRLRVIGQHVDGGLAEFVAARARRLIEIPDHLDSKLAALAEPLSVAVRAVRKTGSMQGRSALIIGGGAVGMLTAQVARNAGADPVVVLEPDATRRDVLQTWGALPVWEAAPGGRAAAVAALVPDRGVDVVFECSGRPGMSNEAVRLARRGGTALLLGVLPELEPIDTLDIVLGEKTVLGSSAHMWDDDVAVAVSMLAAGSIDVAPMITHTIGLDEIEHAFELLVDPSQAIVKLLVSVGDRAPQTGSEPELILGDA